MTIPRIGSRNTTRHHRTFDAGGRLDFRTSTGRRGKSARGYSAGPGLLRGIVARTDDNDVQDQDNEAQNSAAGAVLPGVAVAGGG
jgi:hypothetical protein